MRPQRKMLLVPVLLLMAACNDQDLKTVAGNLDKIEQGVLVASQVAKATNEAHLLSDAATRKVMLAVLQIGPKAKEANQYVRGLSALAQTDRATLKGLLVPFIVVMQDVANDPEIVNVKDPKSQIELKATLTSILTAITVISNTL